MTAPEPEDPDGLGPDPATEEDGLNWNRPEGEEKAYADAWDALVADAGDATAADPEAEGSSSGVTIYGVAATVPGGDTTVTLQAVTYSDGSLSLWIDRPGEARAVCSLELSRPQAAALRLLFCATEAEGEVVTDGR